jgi:hypothetical protein
MRRQADGHTAFTYHRLAGQIPRLRKPVVVCEIRMMIRYLMCLRPALRHLSPLPQIFQQRHTLCRHVRKPRARSTSPPTQKSSFASHFCLIGFDVPPTKKPTMPRKLHQDSHHKCPMSHLRRRNYQMRIFEKPRDSSLASTHWTSPVY